MGDRNVHPRPNPVFSQILIVEWEARAPPSLARHPPVTGAAGGTPFACVGVAWNVHPMDRHALCIRGRWGSGGVLLLQ
jgi:hypothetical protein